METKIIKVTNKGQISLPFKIREVLNIELGDKLIIAQTNDSIIIKNQER